MSRPLALDGDVDLDICVRHVEVMRRLIVTENMSLDDVIAPMDGWFDPSVQGDDLLATTHQHSAASDALVVGRSTFEEMAGNWPKQSNDKTGIAAYFNEVVDPAVQGYGRRLFPDGQPARLTLMDSTAFDGGVVLSTYRIA